MLTVLSRACMALQWCLDHDGERLADYPAVLQRFRHIISAIEGSPEIALFETISVRIFVLVNAKGKWAAHGRNDCEKAEADATLSIMLDQFEIDTAKTYVVTAEVPLPKPAEIVGVVGDIEGVEV